MQYAISNLLCLFNSSHSHKSKFNNQSGHSNECEPEDTLQSYEPLNVLILHRNLVFHSSLEVRRTNPRKRVEPLKKRKIVHSFKDQRR